MKNFKTFLAMLLIFIIDRLIFARISVFSLTPWLGYSFLLIGSAVTTDDMRPIITAAVYGLVLDLTTAGIPAAGMFSFAVSAVLAQFIAGRIFKNSLLVSLVAVFLSAIIGQSIYFLFSARGLEASFARLLVSVILPLAIINTVTAILSYPLSKKLFGERRTV